MSNIPRNIAAMITVTITTMVAADVSLRVGQVTFFSSIVMSTALANVFLLRQAMNVMTPARTIPIPSTYNALGLAKKLQIHSVAFTMTKENSSPPKRNIKCAQRLLPIT